MPGEGLASRIVDRLADVVGAEATLEISGAHIDSCLYHGQVGIDFAQRLLDDGAVVSVPTTLNVGSLDLMHPELYRGDAESGHSARRLMDLYVELGCSPTWTCAPYQLESRPAFGSHVAWAESNAVVFANSVLGARTNRYGDFIDICAAITGRVPAAGLHLDHNRLATAVVNVDGVSEELLDSNVLYPVLGYHLGRLTGSQVPVVVGLKPRLSEDRLKALGAAAASSGSVAMLHVVGSTPEAETVAQALGGHPPHSEFDVSLGDLKAANRALSTVEDGRLGAVSLGTPHYSVAECLTVVELLAGRKVHPGVEVYVSTGRDVLLELGLRGVVVALEEAGVQLVVDTCTYITPIMKNVAGVVLSDSAKWAYYAPANLGVDVIFASVRECVESATAGRVVRDEGLWQ